MCYPKPGNRCSGDRARRTSAVVLQRQRAEVNLAAAEAELKAAEKQPGTLHKVLERRRDHVAQLRAVVAEKKVKEAEAEATWLKTPAGIQHLRQLASDPSLSKQERKRASVEAIAAEESHEKELDALWAARIWDAATDEDLRAHNVPLATREAIRAKREGWSFATDPMPAKKAQALYEEATEELAAAKAEAYHQLKKVEDEELRRYSARLAQVEKQGPEALQGEIRRFRATNPTYLAAKDELNAQIEPHRAACRLARTRYLVTPEGMKELRATERENELALRPESLRAKREAWEAEAEKERRAVNVRFKSQMVAARGTAKEREVVAAYNAALAPHTDEAVKAKMTAHIAKVELAAAETRGQLATAKHIRDAQAKGSRLRQVREDAIRRAVVDAGHSEEEAKAVVERDRASRAHEPGDRRVGRPPRVAAEQRKNKTHRILVTPSEKAEIETQAHSEGLSVSQFAIKRMSAPKQRWFVSEPLSELHAGFTPYRSGLPSRPRTTGAGEARECSITLTVSPAFLELRHQQSTAFNTSMSSLGRDDLFRSDPRQVQNDRSEKSRSEKQVYMQEKHATAAQSRENTPV